MLALRQVVKSTKLIEKPADLKAWIADNIDILGLVQNPANVALLNAIPAGHSWAAVHAELQAETATCLGFFLWGDRLADVIDSAVDAHAKVAASNFIEQNDEATVAGVTAAIDAAVQGCRDLPGADKMKTHREVQPKYYK